MKTGLLIVSLSQPPHRSFQPPPRSFVVFTRMSHIYNHLFPQGSSITLTSSWDTSRSSSASQRLTYRGSETGWGGTPLSPLDYLR